MTTRAFELLQRIQNFGDRATVHNLNLTDCDIDRLKLLELMSILGLIVLDRTVRPSVYRVVEDRMEEALLIDRVPGIEQIEFERNWPVRVVPEKKKPAKKQARKKPQRRKPIQRKPEKEPKRSKWRRPLRSAYASNTPDLIRQMLAVNGELSVVKQLMPLLEGLGCQQSQAQVTAALTALTEKGVVVRRKSFRKIHGVGGVYAYSLVQADVEAAA